MLLKFTVSNFASFGKPKTFSMEGGRVRGKREHLSVSRYSRTLKFAAMYGANAAGKSNFVKAMEFARKVIVNNGKIPSGYTTRYNRSTPENISRPSTFEFEVLLDRKRYTYGFSIVLSSLMFTEEWLYETTVGEKKLFVRSFNENTSLNLPLKGSAERRVRFYFNDIIGDQETLFLREVNRKKDDLYKEEPSIQFLKDIFNWFLRGLVFIYPEDVDPRSYSFTFSADKEALFQKLNVFGLDITDYNYEQTTLDKVFEEIPNQVKEDFRTDIEEELAKRRREGEDESEAFLFNGKDLCSFGLNESGDLSVKIVKTQHGGLGAYLLSEESDGTRRIFELMEVLLSENKNITYVIDEIDRSMHPLLTDAFISEYLSKIHERNVQLIVTTHEARLLNTNRLRRDEIWFADKSNGETDIWRFDSMGDTENTGALARGDIKIEMAYLSGRYGAIPRLMVCTNEDNL